MAFRFAGLALGASVLMLAGCAAEFEPPAPITQAEVKKKVYEGNLQWWTSMFPSEPMPEVEPVAYLDPEAWSGEEVTECLKAQNLPGVRFAADGSWSSSSADGADMNAVNRAHFICTLQYPYDMSDPSALGYLSDAETEWIWAYNRTRLVPCLQLMGYPISNRAADYAAGSNDYWSPYYDIWAQLDETEWRLIDGRCPRAPVGSDWRPYSD